MGKHYSMVETVREMAKRSWGSEHSDRKAAMQSLSVPDAALLSIVERIEQVFCALTNGAVSDDEDDKHASYKKPKDAVPVPWAKIGGRVHECYDLEDGVLCSVVVGADTDGCIQICEIDPRRTYDGPKWVTHDNLYRTPGEALKARAESNLQYHEARTKLARDIVRAIEPGADLSAFEEGVDPDEYVGQPGDV